MYTLPWRKLGTNYAGTWRVRVYSTLRCSVEPEVQRPREKRLQALVTLGSVAPW